MEGVDCSLRILAAWSLVRLWANHPIGPMHLFRTFKDFQGPSKDFKGLSRTFKDLQRTSKDFQGLSKTLKILENP